jgi:3'-phosphoadenosine 5'-phosphosulfate sulfotransferase (PAPS reductase)/FAD synthetase
MQEMQESTATGRVKHILSFGGGVNSVALMILLLRRNEPIDEVVFADTGAEVPETYSYLHLAHHYAATHNVSFTVLARQRPRRDLYETCRHRRVIPSAIWRWSTRDFKVGPIHRHYRSLGAHINQYLGIAYDEVERMKDSRVDYVTNLYPLVDRE